jgi:S1-C subfamily serine protease
MKRIALALVTVAALGLAACSSPAQDLADAEPRVFPSPSQAVTATGPTAVEQVVQRVLPAVVNVVTDGGEGTGFVVREDGVIVTNYHVVEGATSQIRVLTSDQEPEEFAARVIGGDPQADLAVLKVDADGLPTVPLGDSDRLRLGQQVVAIGYALGLEGGPSVTAGIVSSLDREVTVQDPAFGQRVYTSVVQTDAAINPGNSGGPLVDLAGNVVGINTAGTTQAENVGFAIQINAVKETIFGAAENPGQPVAYMGIGAEDAADPAVQFQFNLPVEEGAVIMNVVPGGPADLAGIEVGDVIVGFAGRDIATAEELGDAIRSHRPGERVEVEVVHPDGQRSTVTVELGTNPVPLG